MPSGRAVFLRKNAKRGHAVSAVGTLALAVAVKARVKPVTARSGFQSPPGWPIVDSAREGRGRGPNTRTGRRATAKKAPARKAAKGPGAGRLRGVNAPPRSFSLGFGTGRPEGAAKPKANKPVSPAEVIDVFFATDRRKGGEAKWGITAFLIAYRRRLP